MDAGLKLSVHVTFRRRHGRLLNVSYMLNLHPVTTRTCHNFYYKNSSIEVLEFNNFEHNLSIYVKMAAITYMKIDQNYRKYIFNKIGSPNLQPIRNNENNIKYYWIIFTMSLSTLQLKIKGLFCYCFLNEVHHSIPYTQCCLS